MTTAPTQPNQFVFNEEVVELAKNISIGSLLECGSLDERTIAGILVSLSYCRTNLTKTTNKSVSEKCLQVDLQDLIYAIGQEDFDKAFEFIRKPQPSAQEFSRTPQPVSQLRRLPS